MKPGKRNSIADVKGLSIGNAQNDALKSGVTVLLCDTSHTASVAVHGGAPGTRDTELLSPDNAVTGVDALVLSGGSAFGLDAASGAQAFMREKGRGFSVGSVKVPIVPCAILFDLVNGGDKDWGKFPPYRDLGYEAAQNAGEDVALGSVGAGTGATVPGLKGGLGTASLVLESGFTIAALFAVNAVGSPLIANTAYFRAALFERDGEFGGLGMPATMPDNSDDPVTKLARMAPPGSNTTIGIIATDAELTKSEARRLAIAAHDGIAQAIWPAHTPLDGDLVFTVATGTSGRKPNLPDWVELSAHAASVTARSIARGVYHAESREADIFPAYRDQFGG